MSRADQIRQALEQDLAFADDEVLDVVRGAAREYADWLDGPTDEDVRAYLAGVYGDLIVDMDAYINDIKDAANYEPILRGLEAVRVRREPT